MVQRLLASTFLSTANDDLPVYVMEWNPAWNVEGADESIRPPFLVHVTADPVSWAYIATLVIKAAIAKLAEAIAKEIVNAIFGLEDLVQKFLEGVAAIIHEALRQQWLDETTANAVALQRSLEAYSNSPETRRDQIPIMLDRADTAFSAAEQIGSMALGVATTLAAMRFSINGIKARDSERQGLDAEGDWKTCRSTIDHFGAYVDKVEQDVLVRVQIPIGPVQSRSALQLHVPFYREPGPRDREPNTEYYFDYYGRSIGGYLSAADAERAKANLIQQLQVEAINKTVVPARGVMEEMQQAYDAARSLG